MMTWLRTREGHHVRREKVSKGLPDLHSLTEIERVSSQGNAGDSAVEKLCFRGGVCAHYRMIRVIALKPNWPP